MNFLVNNVQDLVMNDAERLDQLRDVDFLGFFSDETLEKLARTCRVISLAPLEVLFEVYPVN